MSPEQVQGKPVDIRSDIYSLGVTCYHMLTGAPPFTGENAFGVAMQHVNDEPRPLSAARPDLPAKVCDVVHTMMAKKPEHRYQTPRDLLLDLERVRGDQGSFTGTEPVRAAVLGLAGTTGQATALSGASGGSLAIARPRWSRTTWALILSLPLALLAGVALAHAWNSLHGRTATSQDRGSTEIDAGKDSQLSTDASLLADVDRKLEQYYRDGLDKRWHPTKPAELDDAMDIACSLAAFYLERGRITDAEQLFDRLVVEHKYEAGDPGTALHVLGRIGQGMIRALRDKVDIPQNVFRDLLDTSESDRIDAALQRQPRFAAQLGLALERIRQCLDVDKLPGPMEKYRKPRKP
jgi:serine/threonine-protein kinase